LIIITLTCCGEAPLPVETQLTNPCASEDISAYIAGIDDIAKRFEGKTAIAENTSPENLELIIKEMQAIGQELEILDTPSCALKVKAALDSYIFSESQCYFGNYAVEISGKDSQEKKTDFCSLALEQLAYYNTQRNALSE
ncbi:MAG: hypothetical protein HON91_14260, partial [Anaerolineae bacterium]|nr:hypothetical protein [Anaerolineae bacterium]